MPKARMSFLDRIFRSTGRYTQDIKRRRVDVVEKLSSEADLTAEVRRRGFHMIRSGDQYVIFCNSGNFKVIC